MSQVNYCKIINSLNAKFLGQFLNMQGIINECYFNFKSLDIYKQRSSLLVAK